MNSKEYSPIVLVSVLILVLRSLSALIVAHDFRLLLISLSWIGFFSYYKFVKVKTVHAMVTNPNKRHYYFGYAFLSMIVYWMFCFLIFYILTIVVGIPLQK